MARTTTDDRATVAEALRFLAGRCDYAQADDGMGFNGVDARIGHDLAAMDPADWTPRQYRAAWRVIQKYGGQLAQVGIDPAALPEPPVVRRPAAAEVGVTVALDGDDIVIAFPYDAALVELVKALPRRAYRKTPRKHWRAPLVPENVEPLEAFLEATGCRASADLAVRLAALRRLATEADALSRAKTDAFAVAGLGGELLPFQRAGTRYAVERRRVLLADEMGLGKTVQALATVQAADAFPVLVVCPPTLKPVWAAMARHWLPGRSVATVSGLRVDSATRVALRADVVVVNYELLRATGKGRDLKLGPLAAALKAHPWRAVVADEAHLVKNHKAQRTRALKAIARGRDYVLPMTGTPILNRPQELVAILELMDRLRDFGGFWPTLTALGVCRSQWGGLEYRGTPEQLAAFHERLRRTCMVRRRKADVLTELPAKRRASVPLPLTREARDAYARVARDHHDTLEDRHASTAAQLTAITALRQAAAHAKLEAVTEWVRAFLDSGEKLVLFAHHRAVQAALLAAFPAAARVHADDSPDTRAANVRRFQEDDRTRLIVCSLRAAREGITLTAASNVAFAELGWTPGEHDQAEDRCHRIGQPSSVTAWYLLAEGTIDEQLAGVVDEKRSIAAATTDGSLTSDQAGILASLVAKLREAA